MAPNLLNRRLVFKPLEALWPESQGTEEIEGPHQVPWLWRRVTGLPGAVATVYLCQRQAFSDCSCMRDAEWGSSSRPPLTWLIITMRGRKAIVVPLSQLSCGMICYTTTENSSTRWDTGLFTAEYKPQWKFMCLSSQRNFCYSCSSWHVRILHLKWKTSFYILPNC